MPSTRDPGGVSRRQVLRTASVLAGGSWLARVAPGRVALLAQDDALTATRNQMAAAPIERVALGENLTMLAGPGGNVVVLDGPDGKIVVDTFVQPVWDSLRETLDGISAAPITVLVNSHWHFDHTDNNARFREAGAEIVAHANTAQRLSETHELMGMTFEPVADDARPTQTFTNRHALTGNGETLNLGVFSPAHTDTDIYVQYAGANVIHVADTFFNGLYPVIDPGTGGNINGMIGAAESTLRSVDSSTQIVPGHGPLADRAALTRYRDMLVDVRDRVETLKTSGRSLEETVAARPSAAHDAVWGQGVLTPEAFVSLVYSTL